MTNVKKGKKIKTESNHSNTTNTSSSSSTTAIITDNKETKLKNKTKSTKKSSPSPIEQPALKGFHALAVSLTEDNNNPSQARYFYYKKHAGKKVGKRTNMLFAIVLLFLIDEKIYAHTIALFVISYM